MPLIKTQKTVDKKNASLKNFSFIRNAWTVSIRNKNRQVKEMACQILTILRNTLSNLENQNYNISPLPSLHAFNAADESITIEWIFEEFRIGFTIEFDPEESGWYLISSENFGAITASGNLAEINLELIIEWLSLFAIKHSHNGTSK